MDSIFKVTMFFLHLSAPEYAPGANFCINLALKSSTLEGALAFQSLIMLQGGPVPVNSYK